MLIDIYHHLYEIEIIAMIHHVAIVAQKDVAQHIAKVNNRLLIICYCTGEAWKCGNLGSKSMTHYQRIITEAIRHLISGFVSTILTETEQLSLPKTKPILEAKMESNAIYICTFII